MNIDKALVAKRKKVLEEVSKQLKSEFFGLDSIIDKVVGSVYAWYVFPELIRRPIIVNLWGMTGVGKTQLVRRLSALLGYSKKFVEIQMDGTSGGSSYRQDSICTILSNCINEGEEGILLLDEIQRFRTVSDQGEDLKVERFQDVWMLLSDGKFAANSDLFLELEMMVAYQLYAKDAVDDSPVKETTSGKGKVKEVPTVKKRQFKIYPYEARNLKKLLRLSQPVQEIMTWDAQQVETLLDEVRRTKIDWQIDYSKLLIFVSGNLDAAFMGSESTEDCDTDADFYNKITSQITTIEIKKALGKRFKPEQISRLGSNHIIYPSMTRKSYEQLIEATCDKYVVEIQEATDLKFVLEPKIYETIYNNAVYPTQGTRPVFSSIHKIFSTGLVNVACWCLESNVHHVTLSIDEAKQDMVAIDVFSGEEFRTHIDLEISNRRAKVSQDMKTLVAVHEAGHATVYAILTNSAPIETKINAISFANGYMLANDAINANSIITKKTIRDKIAMLLSGMVAEEMVFGEDNRSSGCKADLREATQLAGMYVRSFGYDDTLSFINTIFIQGEITWNTDMSESNKVLEAILQEELVRSKQLLADNREYYTKIVDTLLETGTITQQEFIDLSKDYVELEVEAQVAPFHKEYGKFISDK